MGARVLLRCALISVLVAVGCARASEDLVVILPQAPGIREGSPIDYLGVEVGEVARVSFVRGSVGPPQVALHLRLRRDSVPLRAADSVRIRNIGIFGDQALTIVPGPSNARELGRGDTLLAASEPVPVRPDLGRVLEALSREVVSERNTRTRATRHGVCLDRDA